MSLEYLQDLLKRMDNNDLAPQFAALTSNTQTISWQAHREAEQLDDAKLLPHLECLVEQAKRVRDFQKIAIVLGNFVKNTSLGHHAFSQLMSRAPSSDAAWDYILTQARKAKIAAARPYAIRILKKPFKREMAFIEAIELIGVLGIPEDLLLIAELLDNDCNGKCHPMYCVFALANIGELAAVPHLEKCIKKRRGSRKRVDHETIDYAKFAIEHIVHRPPGQIADSLLISWSLTPTTDRLAIVESDGGCRLLTCDVHWKINNYETFSDSGIATKIANDRYSNAVDWHQHKIMI
ncbi:MAG: hypothetical protein AAGA30_06030 [Planctomycetota bacterium]